MKNIFKLMGGAMIVALAFTACSPEEFEGPNQAGLPKAADYESNVHVDVDQSTNIATFSFDAVNGVTPVWILDGSIYNSDYTFNKYYRKAGDYSVDFKVKNANGISDGMLTKTFHIDKTKMNGFGGYVYDTDFNLWKKANVGTPAFYYAPGWSQISNPTYTFNNGDFTVQLPEATTDRWQAQMLIPTDINTSSASNYDFSVILTSKKGTKGVMVKLVDPNDDNIYYCAEEVSLDAGEPKCFYMSNMPGLDINNLKFVFDFGGNAANDEINIESIVFKNHADDDGTVVPEKPTEQEPIWASENSEENLWYNCTFNNSYYYAPNWSQIADPTVRVNDHEYSFALPTATSDQWQAQVFFNTDIATDATTPYDFSITLNSSTDIKNVTVKLCQSDENGVSHGDNYYFVKQVNLSADSDTKVWVANTLPAIGDMHAVSLVLDFGGNPDNTNIKVSKIIMQKHRN